MPIISEQVKILLDRMDMHPDEFVHPYESRNINSKWGEVLDEGTFNRLERFLIKRKMRALKRKVTQDLILATIMYEGESMREEDFIPRQFSNRRMFTPKDIENMKSQWYADANNNRL
jgi:hypothetical protein